MGSKTFDGVRFSSFSLDHAPPHVHGTLSGVVVVLDLLGNGDFRIADRARAVIPASAKQNVIDRIRRVAAENITELEAL